MISDSSAERSGCAEEKHVRLDRLKSAERPKDLVPLGNLGGSDRTKSFHAEALDIEAGDDTPFHHGLTQCIEGDLLLLSQIFMTDVTTGKITGQTAGKAIAGASGIMDVFEGVSRATEELTVAKE